MQADSAAEAMQRALDEGKSLDEDLTRVADEEVTPNLFEGDADPEPRGRGDARQ